MTESDRTSNTAVINVGLPLFADAVRQQGALVQDVAWTIPAEGDSADIASLKVAYGESSAEIDESNNEVVRRLNEGIPLLTGVVPAQQAVDAFADGMLLLHSGPPYRTRSFVRSTSSLDDSSRGVRGLGEDGR